MSTPIRTYAIPGEDLIWSGRCPWTGGLCFGSEQGSLFIQDPNTKDGYDKCVVTREAVNGVTFSGDFMAVSSCGETSVWKKDRSHAALIEMGAFGVVSSTQGLFLAPIGVNGIVRIDPLPPQAVAKLFRPAGSPANVYKIIRLGADSGGEVFACACRRDGLGWFRFKDGMIQPMVQRVVAHDLVDVCALSSSGPPFAVACLTKEGVIILSRDLVSHTPLVGLAPLSSGQTGYSLLATHRHLITLTDEELYVFPDLVSHFLSDQDPKLNAVQMRTTASDASLMDDDTLLLVEDDFVGEYSISDLIEQSRPSSQDGRNGRIDILTQDASTDRWNDEDVRVQVA